MMRMQRRCSGLVACGVGVVLLVAGCRGGSRGDSDEGTATGESRAGAPAAEAAPTSGASGQFDPTVAEAEIRKAFDEFRAAMQARDGKRALSLVSSNTIARYEALRGLAAAALADPAGSRAAIQARTLGERLMMVQLISILGRYHLERATGEEMLAFGIERGFIGGQTFTKLEALGELRLVNDVIALAVLEGVGAQDEAPPELRFIREGGGWRVDLSSLMDHADAQLRADQRKLGLSDEVYLAKVIEGLPAPQPMDPWRRVTSAQGGFSVELPGAPEELADEVAQSVLSAPSVTGAYCFAASSEVEAVADAAAADALLESQARELVAGLSGTIDWAQREEGSGGERALRLGFSMSQGVRAGDRGTARLVLSGARLLQVMALGPQSGSWQEVERRCVESLRAEGG